MPFLDLLSQPTFGQRQCGFALALGLRLDEVGEPFGLGQIDAAVLERSAGVLTGLRSPQTGKSAKRIENRIDDCATAVAMEFYHVVAGRTRWRIEPQDQGLVEQLA